METTSVFLTNSCFGLEPVGVAQIYKSRWQTEAFFKRMKQNLQFKTHPWIAASAHLTVSYMNRRLKSGWSIHGIPQLLEISVLEGFAKGVNNRVYHLIFECPSSLSKFLGPHLQEVNRRLKISSALNITQI